MGKDVTIRHLPEFVRDELKRRARDEGKSFQEYMLGVLAEIAANPDAEVLAAEMGGTTSTRPAERMGDPRNGRVAPKVIRRRHGVASILMGVTG